ncbi:hypothetical protein ACWGI8_35915 [Streptomyces sp. NPDC054841]
MRPAHDVAAGPSATPIYDALYSEYLRAFRTLPGDRSGEENLGFSAFGTGQHGLTGHGGFGGQSGIGWQSAPVRQTGGRQHHTPAALPPAPRRGL